MKFLLRFILLLAAAFTFTNQLSAQPRKGAERISREQLAVKQARHISEQLCLSPEVSERFINTYMKCQHEIWNLGPRQGNPRKGPLSDSQTDSVIQSRFNHSQKILNIRKKYYAEYSKFLTARQIERVYDLERQMMKRLSRRANKTAGR